MKIVLDGRCLYTNKKHGIARYTESLIRHLPLGHDDALVVLYNQEYFQPWQQDQVEWVSISTKLLSVKEQYKIPKLLKKLKADLFHTPSYVVPYSIPCPFVMTLHDLIHIQYPEDYTLNHRLYYQFWVKRMALKSNHILTVSQYSKTIIQKWLSTEHPVSVTPLGVEPEFKPLDLWITTIKKYPVITPYMLYVGNEKPHKNFKQVFEAFSLFIDHHGPICNLVVLGLSQAHQKPHPNIQYIPYVPEVDLPAFYSGARMLIYPSLEEGFGLPVLEAMASGTPVIVSDIPVLKEIAGEAGTFISTESSMALVEAISLLLSNRDMIRFLKQKGLERASEFNWQKTAWKTIKVYKDIING